MRARLPWVVAWALLALLSGPGLASNDDERVAWLRANAIPLAASASSDLADLEPLRKVLGGVRVVMLGDATRGDGSAFLAKTRLVRFLYEELGFDILAFEGGFYDGARAWDEIRAGADPREALGRALFPFYTEAAEFQPLLELIGARAASARPLAVAGIDNQLSHEPNGSRLLAELRSALPGFGFEPASVGGFAELEAALLDVLLGRHLSGEAAVPSSRDRRRLVTTLEDLRRRLATGPDSQPGHPRPDLRLAAAGSRDRAFWLQMLDNLQTDAEANWRMGKRQPGQAFSPELNNLRDRQMADNLVWLVRHGYRGHKIVVWSLNVHLARDLDRLTTAAGDAVTRAKFDEMSTVGDRVARELGQEVYTIATTAFGGRHGTPFRDPQLLPMPTPGSFEELMGRTGLEAALVDLRHLPSGGRWLQRSLVARPISYKELLGIWPRHVDGLLFVRRMEAASRAGR